MLTAYSRYRATATNPKTYDTKRKMPNVTPQMSVADYNALKNKPQRKYRNEVIDTADGKFDSKKEYKRWVELKQLQKAGVISELERQVRYPLQVTGEGGAMIISNYYADFVYKQNDLTIVEDAKGFRTREYQLKKKLMKAIFNIDIKEV